MAQKRCPLDLDVDDFLRDMEGLPLDVVGAWIKILGRMHQASERGTLTRSRQEWSATLGVSQDAAKTLLKTLLSKRICDGKYDSDAAVTLESRRMVRERTTLLLKRQRQERFQEKKRKQEGESEGEWLAELRRIFTHVDFDFELNLARRWILDHPGRHFTKQFFLNWLSKKPRPVNVPVLKPPPKPQPLTFRHLTAHPAAEETPEAREARIKAIAAIGEFVGRSGSTEFDRLKP